MPRKLKPSERRARAALEPHLGPLVPIEETHKHKTPDFRTPDGKGAVEVKEMTSKDYKQITAAHRSMPTSWDLDELSGRWHIIDMAPTMSDTHEPMPSFDDPDQATIDHFSSIGHHVMTRAEREAEWQDQATRPRPQIRLAGLGHELEAHLAVLEREGDTQVETFPFARSEPVQAATAAIRGLIHGALCLRHEPVAGQQPGVDLHLGRAHVRTGNADTIAQRVQLWLDRGGDHVDNLVETLALESAGTCRHAAVVLDAGEEPEYQAVVKQGTRFVPTIALDLPGPVDVLWAVLGPVVLRYADDNGWRTSEAPPAAA